MANANAIFFGNGKALNISAMTTPAPFLDDVAIDDKTTLYSNSGAGSASGKGICAYWDFGSSKSADGIRCTVEADGDVSNTCVLHSSDNGTTWTLRKLVSSTGFGTLTSFNQAFTIATARYWRLEASGTVSDNLTSMTAGISDFRLSIGGDIYILANYGAFVVPQAVKRASFY